MQQVSFTGTYIKPITIKKLAANGEFVPHEVSLVQFDANNPLDIQVIRDTCNEWKIFGNCFVEIIRDVANWLHGLKRPQKSRKIFFLTNQQYGFENLNPDEILGQFMVWNKKNTNNVQLEVLQTNPFHSYDVAEFRRYSEIGKSMVDEIKEQYRGKIIKLYSDKDATGFYEKQGFVPDTPGSLDYTYTP
ncbi:hypothetical protein IKL64_05200 [bacterium]|nr:hypothetical protein [bacterium]